MKKNIGLADRIMRILLAAIFGVLYFSGAVTGTIGFIFLGLSIIFVLTSLVSFCPIYAIAGVDTCERGHEKA